MFGISFTEILLIAVVAIVVVGPQKLPRMLGSIGNFIGKMRRVATDMRRQTGIDEILRSEGLDGGLNELRGMMRGNLVDLGHPGRPGPGASGDPYGDHVEYDRTREYPVEGPDCYDAIPEDLAADLEAEPDALGLDVANADPGLAATGTEGAERAEQSGTGDPRPGEPTDPPATKAADLPATTKASA